MKKMVSLLALLGAVCCAKGQDVDNTPVDYLDASRYLGKWYEIAKYDHSFERDVQFATARYTLMENGKIKVENKGIKNGMEKISTGKAKFTETPGLLRVSFFGPFYSDYRVLMVDENYRYALVGSGSSDYLWILSRTRTVPQDVLADILAVAKSRGYNTDKLIWVKQ